MKSESSLTKHKERWLQSVYSKQLIMLITFWVFSQIVEDSILGRRIAE